MHKNTEIVQETNIFNMVPYSFNIIRNPIQNISMNINRI